MEGAATAGCSCNAVLVLHRFIFTVLLPPEKQKQQEKHLLYGSARVHVLANNYDKPSFNFKVQLLLHAIVLNTDGFLCGRKDVHISSRY